MSGPGWPSDPPECPSQQLVSTRCGAGDSLLGQGDAAKADRPGSRPLGASGSRRDRETARFVRQLWRCEQSWRHSLWVSVVLQSLWLPRPVRLGSVLGTEGRSRGRLCIGHSQYEAARDERPQVNLHADRGSSPALVLCIIPLGKALSRVKQFGRPRAKLLSQKELPLKAGRLQSRDVSSGRFYSLLRV